MKRHVAGKVTYLLPKTTIHPSLWLMGLWKPSAEIKAGVGKDSSLHLRFPPVDCSEDTLQPTGAD